MNRAPTMLLAATCMTAVSGCQTIPETTSARLLSAAEVLALHRDQTVEMVERATGTTRFAYFAADGRLLEEQLWRQRTGHWSVDGDGRLCVTLEQTRCEPVMARGGRYYRVDPDDAERHRPVSSYRHLAPGDRLTPRRTVG